MSKCPALEQRFPSSAGLLGGHQAVRHSSSKLTTWNLQFLSKFPSLQTVILQIFPNFKSCRFQPWNTQSWSLQVGCLLVVVVPGINLFTLTWAGSQDSVASQPDHRIQWNSNDFPIPSETIKMVPGDLPKPPKWGLKRCLKASKSQNSQRSEI